MVQTWIIPKDTAPNVAIQTGKDRSVCGSCPLRPIETRGTDKPMCYVTSSGGMRMITNIWKSYQAGAIPHIRDTSDYILSGHQVRLGSYGEPTAVPLLTSHPYLFYASHIIGYTHRWRECDQDWQHYLMASVESEEERVRAKEMGWRTFRIRGNTDSVLRGEVVCPASLEGGRKLTCSECMHCDGQARLKHGDVVIIAH